MDATTRSKDGPNDGRICVACHGSLAPFGERLDWQYRRCSRCGTIQLSPVPTEEDLAHAYRSGALLEHVEPDPDRSRAAAWTYYESLVRILEEYRVDGLVVDYGSGWGGLSERLRDRGFDVRGVEISEDMARSCAERGLPVEAGDLATLERAGLRDASAFVLCAVFEHLVDHDRWMERSRALLREGGLVVSLQPTARFAGLAADWIRLGRRSRPLPALDRLFAPPWHVALFSLEGMARLAARNGFELLDVRPAPQGRLPGFPGLLQRLLEQVNRVGWRVAGRRWPLLTAHIFVLRARPREHGDARSAPGE